jgi:hypothetical protein
MSIDVSKLSPASWFINPRTGHLCHGDPDDDSENYVVDDPDKDELTALARNVLDAQERRLWQISRVALGAYSGGWVIRHDLRNKGEEFHNIIDGVYATLVVCWEHIVKADRWLTEREKNP